MESKRNRSVIPGIGAVGLGLLALAIAAVEYTVFADIAPAAGSGDTFLGVSTGTAAYVAGYSAAGVILIVLGVVKITLARRGR